MGQETERPRTMRTHSRDSSSLGRNSFTSSSHFGDQARGRFKMNQVLNCCCSKSGVSNDSQLTQQDTEAEEPPSPTEQKLWNCARDGDLKGVQGLLRDQSVNVNCWIPASDRMKYKSRKVRSQPLHAAAFFQAETSPESGAQDVVEIVKLLLEHRANPVSPASSSVTGVKQATEVRTLQAIHVAAGSGNAEVIQLLVNARADPDQATTIQKGGKEEFHYRPVHDAAWFGHINSIRMLMRLRADIQAANNEGNTGLHLAAKLGHVETVRILTEAAMPSSCPLKKLKKSKTSTLPSATVATPNNKNETALDLAVKGGLYPLNELHLFTQCLSREDRVQAFVSMATVSPEAATAMLEKPCDEFDDDEPLRCAARIDEEWRDSFVLGARERTLTPRTVAHLIHCAPKAAAYLLEALTVEPVVQDKGHNALPIRAKIDRTFGAGAVSCEYVGECKWKWEKTRNNGRRKWHDRLAPLDNKHGQGVHVKVAKMPGIVSVGVLHALAETPNYEVFTKITVHALLKLTWRTFKVLFITDLVQEVLVTLVISKWIVLSDIVCECIVFERMLWCFVFSYGVLEVSNFAWIVCSCRKKLGWKRCGWLAFREAKSFVLGCSTLALVLWEVDWDRGVHGDGGSVILAMSSLFHWMHVLYQLRAFQPTGKKLLPIQKSLAHIIGMLVIMAFLLAAFVHAFWAIDLSAPIDVKLFDVATLLFTGEAFLEREEVGKMYLNERIFVMLLTMLSVFVFLACALNVFIAVLGDSYDLEQERMVCTFLKERAKICAALFLRPSGNWLADCTGDQADVTIKTEEEEEDEQNDPYDNRNYYLSAQVYCTSFLCVGMCLVLLIVSAKVSAEVSSFLILLAALCLGSAILRVQVGLRGALTLKWEEKYLWVCHELGLQEEMSLMQENCSIDKYNHSGREGRLKRFVDKQCRQVARQSKLIKDNMISLGLWEEYDEEVAKDLEAVEGVKNEARQKCGRPSSNHLYIPDHRAPISRKSTGASLESVDAKPKSALMGRLDRICSLLAQRSDGAEAHCQELERKMLESASESGRAEAEARCQELERKTQESEARCRELERKMLESASESGRAEAEARCQELERKMQESEARRQELEQKMGDMEKEKNELLRQILDRAMTAREAEMAECKARLAAEHRRDVLQDRCHVLEAQLRAVGVEPAVRKLPAPPSPRLASRPETPDGTPPQLRHTSKESHTTPNILGVLFDKHRTVAPGSRRSRLEPEALQKCVREVLGEAATPEIYERVKQHADGVGRRQFYKFFDWACAEVDATQLGAAVLEVARTASDGSQQ